MATAKLGEYPVFRAYDTVTKLPLDGGKLYTYENGTTTDKAVYTDEAKTTEDTNPVILNSNGEATFYMDGEYTFKLTTSLDVNLWTVDGINKQTTSASVAYDSNLIENPSFELDSDSDGSPDNWTKTTWGTVAFDTTDPYHGDQALKFTSVGSGGGQIISTNFIDVSVANNYILRFSLKSSVVGIRNVVEILWYDKDQAAISTVSAYDDSTTNPTSWTEKIVTMTPGTAAMFAKVRITGAHNSDSTPGNVLFDHISLQEQRSLDLETSTAQTIASAVTLSSTLDVTGAVTIDGKTTLSTDSYSGAPGVVGQSVEEQALTFTDSSTAGSGTQASVAFHGIAQPILAATNSSVTTTDAAAVYIANAPAAGTNQTITNSWALWIDAGNVRFDGDIYQGATKISGTTVSGFVRGHLMQVESTVGALSTQLDVDSLIGSTFESVGPTGSSPDNTWTALNNVPSTAKFIFVKLVIELQEDSGTASAELWARKTGDGTASSDRLSVCRYRHTAAGARDFNVFTLPPIPIDSARRFDLKRSTTGTPTTDIAHMYLIGWGEDTFA